MKRFIVLYHAPPASEEQLAQMTPEQQAEGMKLWMAWASKCGNALVDLGQPLGNGKALMPGGESGPSSKEVAGYSILEAENMDAAVALLQDHPHLGWNAACSIEVHETQPLPGI